MDNEPFSASDCSEWRRMQAWRLKQLGWKQRNIATALAASEGAVSQWLAVARREGPEALRSRSTPGHPAKLTADQRRRLPDFLWHGPEAYGFRGTPIPPHRSILHQNENELVIYHRRSGGMR